MRGFRSHESGPFLIAVGLGILIANWISRAVPVITAVSLITLGATIEVASRSRCSPARQALIAVHLFTYSILYLLFVGAGLHAAFANSTGGLSLLQSLDLALSVGPIVAAVRIAISSLAGGGDAPAR